MFGMLRMLSVGLLRLADIHDGAEHGSHWSKRKQSVRKRVGVYYDYKWR